MTLFDDTFWWQFLIFDFLKFVLHLWLVTFETLITILTIENLDSWQSLLPDNSTQNCWVVALPQFSSIVIVIDGLTRNSRYFERRQSIAQIKHRWCFSSWVGCNVKSEELQRDVGRAVELCVNQIIPGTIWPDTRLGHWGRPNIGVSGFHCILCIVPNCTSGLHKPDWTHSTARYRMTALHPLQLSLNLN